MNGKSRHTQELFIWAFVRVRPAAYRQFQLQRYHTCSRNCRNVRYENGSSGYLKRPGPIVSPLQRHAMLNRDAFFLSFAHRGITRAIAHWASVFVRETDTRKREASNEAGRLQTERPLQRRVVFKSRRLCQASKLHSMGSTRPESSDMSVFLKKPCNRHLTQRPSTQEGHALEIRHNCVP